MSAWFRKPLMTSGWGWKPGLPMSWKVSLAAVASVRAGAKVSVVTFAATADPVTRRTRFELFDPDVGQMYQPLYSSAAPSGSWFVTNVVDSPVAVAVSSKIAPQL